MSENKHNEIKILGISIWKLFVYFIIYGFAGVKDAFETGRGRIVIRAKAEIEVDSTTGRETIVVSEIPYAVNKSELIK